MRKKILNSIPKKNLMVIFTLFVLGVVACEKQVPLSNFHFDYTPEYQIEADFYPQNLGKSILRINRTFTIADSMSLEDAYVKNASARLLDPDGQTLSTFTWYDSAAGYQYINMDEQIDSNISLDSLAQHLDTLIYGGYRLNRTHFQMDSGKEYELRVVINGKTFETTFTPYPPVDFLPFAVDSVVQVESGNGAGHYQRIYATMTSDTAKLRWPEDPNAYLYTVVTEQIDNDLNLGAQAFAFPGPVLNFGILPGTYNIIIGSMDKRFYDHYYLSDFPPNHPDRNFFNGKALGYAGSVNERYLTIHVIPPGQ